MSNRRVHPRRAFTLVEMVVSVAAGSVLVAGMASSIYMATQAIDGKSTSEAGFVTSGTLSQLVVDCSEALVFEERSDTAIEFLVGDRDADGYPERIRYSWTGTIGDPLLMSINGGADLEILTDVHHFNLSYDRKSTSEPQRVLLVLPNAASLTMQDRLRIEQFKAWSLPVELITATASLADYELAMTRNDVAYIPEDVLSSQVNTKLKWAGIGVVWEEGLLNDEFGLAQSSGTYGATQIKITADSHPITAGYTGNVTITKTSQNLINSVSTGSPDRVTVATDSGGSRRAFEALNTDGQLWGGGLANGRRVMLPFGGGSFQFEQLTRDGLILVRRAIEWAGDSKKLVRIDIELQQSGDSIGWTRTQVQPNNSPRVSGP